MFGDAPKSPFACHAGSHGIIMEKTSRTCCSSGAFLMHFFPARALGLSLTYFPVRGDIKWHLGSFVTLFMHRLSLKHIAACGCQVSVRELKSRNPLPYAC